MQIYLFLLYSLCLFLFLSFCCFFVTKQYKQSQKSIQILNRPINFISNPFLNVSSFKVLLEVFNESFSFKSLMLYCTLFLMFRNLTRSDIAILIHYKGWILEKKSTEIIALYNYSLSLFYKPFYISPKLALFLLLSG